MDFNNWTANIRSILQINEKSLTLQNGHWNLPTRKKSIYQFGPRIFDQHLEIFKECAIEVLSELDPQFELPPCERYGANVKGKVLKHSKDIREGLAETLALLGNQGDAFVHCSRDKAGSIAVLTLRGIFINLDWKVWASLDRLLPTLAEAAPDEFLNSVEKALKRKPTPFDKIFAQERSGITGANYMSGLLWALESLSWDQDYIVRVALILADLATHDPGGNWCNRPVNSIISILLPWFPQTLASIGKRFSTIQAIKKEFPEVAWKVLLQMLPNQHQSSSGTYKPRWRNPVSEDWKPTVTDKEYNIQIMRYAELAVEMACGNLDRLVKLVDNLDNLPKASFEALLEHISSEIAPLKENDRMPVWLNLIDFANKHRRFSDTKWALGDEFVSKIEMVAKIIAPTSLEGQYRMLFSNRDHDLYEEDRDLEKQRDKLCQRRYQAINEIFNQSGLNRVIAFANTVDAPYLVGFSLGKIEDKDIDDALLPAFLDDNIDSIKNFINGFVRNRLLCQGWEWVDNLDRKKWAVEHNYRFLMYLPFDIDSWTRAGKWLGKSECIYWKRVMVNPFQTKGDLLFAVDKLLGVSRPSVAIDCLYCRLHISHKDLPLDKERTVDALLKSVNSEETTKSIDRYHVIELIKALQNDSDVNEDDLFRVEWAYLTLLLSHGAPGPKILEKWLATQPDFFCEIIQLIYRSREDKEPHKELDGHREALLDNAWRLIHDWKRMPGLDDDELFCATDFELWFESVKKQCTELGRFEVAMSTVGGVLFYCPPDLDGLWIIRKIAEALNERDAEDLRRGFYFGAINSRGAHWVDENAQPERDLAAQWRQKAEEVEDAGYPRLGGIARDIAKHYEREAKQIIEKNTLKK